MHARELLELAAIVSAHGPLLVEATGRLPASSLDDYWSASKCRLDRWSRSLKQFSDTPPGDRNQRALRWPAIAGVLDEVLTGEVLTRVWTAVLCAYDRRRGQCEAEPVARSVLIGHLEGRHRVLMLLVKSQAIGAQEAVKLNRLRRRCERWTDVLLSHLWSLHDLAEFAFEPDRAREFADDLHEQSRQPGGRQAWPLMLASLRAAFQEALLAPSPNADLNAKIGAGILACFPGNLFDSVGLLRSLWLHRLQTTTDDAQGMIDLLLGEPAAPAPIAAPATFRREPRWEHGTE